MRMLISRRVLASAASILLILPSIAAAQSWPTRPITLICPFGAGGAPDIIARFVAQELGDKLGQKVVVENRTGASGNIGTAAVAKAAPDGYTLLLGTPSPLVINRLIEGTKQSFDPDTELTPIGVIGKSASDTGHVAPVKGEDAAGFGRGGEGQSRRHECRRARPWHQQPHRHGSC